MKKKNKLFLSNCVWLVEHAENVFTLHVLCGSLPIRDFKSDQLYIYIGEIDIGRTANNIN